MFKYKIKKSIKMEDKEIAPAKKVAEKPVAKTTMGKEFEASIQEEHSILEVSKAAKKVVEEIVNAVKKEMAEKNSKI